MPKELMESLRKAKDLTDKDEKRIKYDEINRDYFSAFIKELKKTTTAVGCHIMSVGYESIIPALIEVIK